MTDRRILHVLSVASFAVLLATLFTPSNSGRILAAILLAVLAVLAFWFLKKRSILSINKRQILLIMTVIGLLYLMLYYLSGLHFGFYRALRLFSLNTFLRFILPIAVIIVSSEVLRSIVRAQNNRAADVFVYFSCVFGQILISSSFSQINTVNKLMDLVGVALFPALTANLLYHYLSKRYGALPNIVYRLLTTLYIYIIPYTPAMAEALFSFLNLLLPLLIFLFIDLLFEKKRRYALGKKRRFAVVITVLAVTIMVSTVMLISNQFRYGALVIATESMTGELNKGDVALFEQYDDQIITVGQVIVFEKYNSMVVHRVIDIKRVNGKNQYYTQGDANKDPDAGYITDSEIVGLVYLKVPYIGHPTIWLRNLFDR